MQTQTRIQKAQKGDVHAMTELFESDKSIIWFLCRALLQDETEADRASIYVFNRTWSEIVDGKIASEEKTLNFAIRRAVIYCKGKVYKQNKKAFRIPTNCNFIPAYDIERMNLQGDLSEIILANLPVFQRFLYVIHTVAGYSEDELAELFAIKVKVVKKALEDESANILKITTLAERYLKINANVNINIFHDTIARKALESQVSKRVEEAVHQDIKKICLPIQKKRKRKQIRILAASCAGILILCAVVGGLISGKTKKPGIGEETLVSDESDSEGSSVGNDSEILDEGTVTDISSEDMGEMSIEATYYANIAIEGYGTITVALDGNSAPETVENFVSLAESGFYDGLTFHRIIKGFIMQGGDPNGDGTGGSENTITGEFSDNGIENNLSHTRGAVAMARSSDYDSASSQFYIVQEDCTSLDGQYAVFGYVTEGMDIVDEICSSAEPTDDNGTIPANEQPVIISITVTKVENNEEDAD